jgi:hypothetical protein
MWSVVKMKSEHNIEAAESDLSLVFSQWVIRWKSKLTTLEWMLVVHKVFSTSIGLTLELLMKEERDGS